MVNYGLITMFVLFCAISKSEPFHQITLDMNCESGAACPDNMNAIDGIGGWASTQCKICVQNNGYRICTRAVEGNSVSFQIISSAWDSASGWAGLTESWSWKTDEHTYIWSYCDDRLWIDRIFWNYSQGETADINDWVNVKTMGLDNNYGWCIARNSADGGYADLAGLQNYADDCAQTVRFNGGSNVNTWSYWHTDCPANSWWPTAQVVYGAIECLGGPWNADPECVAVPPDATPCHEYVNEKCRCTKAAPLQNDGRRRCYLRSDEEHTRCRLLDNTISTAKMEPCAGDYGNENGGARIAGCQFEKIEDDEGNGGWCHPYGDTGDLCHDYDNLDACNGVQPADHYYLPNTCPQWCAAERCLAEPLCTGFTLRKTDGRFKLKGPAFEGVVDSGTSSSVNYECFKRFVYGEDRRRRLLQNEIRPVIGGRGEDNPDGEGSY